MSSPQCKRTLQIVWHLMCANKAAISSIENMKCDSLYCPSNNLLYAFDFDDSEYEK